MSSTDLFFELIKVALGNKQSLSKPPTSQEWLSIKRMAEAQSIDSILLDGFERDHADQDDAQNEGGDTEVHALLLGDAVV